MSTDTPVHVVSSFVHFVTQWMSTVNVSCGSAMNSSQVQVERIVDLAVDPEVQSSVSVRGVGPADSTGKSSTTYWPGGTRDVSTSRRGRPRKPRETKAMAQPSQRRAARHAATLMFSGSDKQAQERLREVVLDDGALVDLAARRRS